MEKIKFTLNDTNEEVEFEVIEETKINGTNYLLVTESEDDEEEVEAYILKDLSKEDEEDAIYVMVEDDQEMDAVSRIFAEILDDVDLEM